jgi:ligand-binding sensor domain-containing protein
MSNLYPFFKAKAVILLLIATVSLSAQSPFFSTVRLDATLKTFETNVIFQDSKGFIWFGTNQGLFRYDGIETVKYGAELGFSTSEITALGEDKNGQLWLGHKSGEISYRNNEMFHSFNPEEGLPTVAISDIFFDAAGVLWFGTLGEGVYYFKGIHRKRLYNLDSESGLNDNYAYSIAQCSKGNVYVGTDNGIAVIDTATNKVEKHISMKDGLPDNIVRRLQTVGSEIWIGMDEGGISRYDILKSTFNLHVPLAFGRMNDFAIRSDNELWISTQRNGVVRISLFKDGQVALKQFTQTHGLK